MPSGFAETLSFEFFSRLFSFVIHEVFFPRGREKNLLQLLEENVTLCTKILQTYTIAF